MRQIGVHIALDNGGGDGVYHAAAGTLETLFAAAEMITHYCTYIRALLS